MMRDPTSSNHPNESGHDHNTNHHNDDSHREAPPPLHRIVVLDPDYSTLHLQSFPHAAPPTTTTRSPPSGILLVGSFEDDHYHYHHHHRRPATFYDHDDNNSSSSSHDGSDNYQRNNNTTCSDDDDPEWGDYDGNHDQNGTSLLEYYESRAQQWNHHHHHPTAHDTHDTPNQNTTTTARSHCPRNHQEPGTTQRHNNNNNNNTSSSSNKHGQKSTKYVMNEEPLRFVRLALLSHFFFVAGSALLLSYTLGPLCHYYFHSNNNNDHNDDWRSNGISMHIHDLGMDTFLSQPMLLLGSAMFCFLQLGFFDFVRTLQLFHISQLLAGMIGLVAAMLYHAHRRISQWFYLLLFSYAMLCQAVCLWYQHYDAMVVAVAKVKRLEATPDPTHTSATTTSHDDQQHSQRQRNKNKKKQGHFAALNEDPTPSGLVTDRRDPIGRRPSSSSSSSSQDFCVDNSFSFDEEQQRQENDTDEAICNLRHHPTTTSNPSPSSSSSCNNRKAGMANHHPDHDDPRDNGCATFLADHYGPIRCYVADSIFVLGAVWQLVVSHWEFVSYGHEGLVDATLSTELQDGQGMPPLLHDTSPQGQVLLIVRVVPPFLWLVSALIQSFLTLVLYVRQRRQQPSSTRKQQASTNSHRPATTQRQRKTTATIPAICTGVPPILRK